MSNAIPDSFIRPYLRAARDLRDNPRQWQAYESKSHCVLLAGPGSGKTKTLTVKMARMLAEDVQAPRGVACITYSNECAAELERRLAGLGVREQPRVFVGTIHSFCLKHVLQPFARLAGLPVPVRIGVAIESDRTQCFETAFDAVYKGKPDTRWWTSFEQYRNPRFDRLSEDWPGTDGDMAQLVEMYESLMLTRGVVDFYDMVRLGLQLIESNRWVRSCLLAKFPILVVDEYQDLGEPLHRIVKALCFEGGIRLFAVGDPDQSVYGFNHAKPELLRQLAEEDQVESISLEMNYRSGQRLIDVSQVVLGAPRGYRAKTPMAGVVTSMKISDGLRAQAQTICDELIPAILGRRAGRKLGDIAILYLDKNDGQIIEDATRSVGLKSIRIDGGAAYRKGRLVRWLEDCAHWCSGGWKTGKPALSELINQWAAWHSRRCAGNGMHTRTIEFMRFLLANRNPNGAAHLWIESANEILRELSTDVSLGDEFLAVESLRRAFGERGRLHNLALREFGGQRGSPEHLNLITLHSAKGLEFDAVVLMGMEQGRMPRWSAKSPGKKQEERRLFYVGVTRARHEVHFTYSGWYADNRGVKREDGPSEFLREVANHARSRRKGEQQ